MESKPSPNVLQAIHTLHVKTSGNTKRIETAVVVILWFVFNISLSNFTKWLFLYGEICIQGQGCHMYNFPYAITVLHMIFSWAVCHIQIRYFREAKKGGELSWEQQFRKVVPLASVFALSVAMGNSSLKYIYPSFNQMLGAMSPLITVFMAVLITRKQYNKWTWFSMPVICGGLVVCTTKEVNFHYVGAFFAIGATVLRALKSIIQGRLLVDPSEKLDSVTLLYYMAPYAALLLFLISLATEGVLPYTILLPRFKDSSKDEEPVTGLGHVMGLLCVSGLNACFLNITNFLVTSYTSAVTLQVLGNVKSCVSIGVSVAIFRNSLKMSQIAGVVTCLVGVWIYNEKGGTVKPPPESSPDTSKTGVEPTPTTGVTELANVAEKNGQAHIRNSSLEGTKDMSPGAKKSADP